uniref:Cation/H+ exchanger domain-containing protein n=1 Tax=Parascaris equorum TaxID=6256 RepID=A0A914RF01_PAREQ
LALNSGFFWYKPQKISDVFPDSSLLIIVGLVLGVGLKLYHVDDSLFTLESTAFFLYLLPPIIFDAGCAKFIFGKGSLPFSIFFSGTSLYALGEYGIFSVQFSIFEIFLFSALISAVDPVAVIAVFEEIHVLYQMFKKFTLIGADNFFVIGLGGAAIGLVYAIIVSFITKYVPILPQEETNTAVGIFLQTLRR